jgi:hypothetical protein
MEALVFPSASLLIFLILTERVTVRLWNTRGLKLKIGLRIFALEITPEDKIHPAKKKKSNKKSRKSAASALKFILKRSSLTINELTVTKGGISPFAFSLLCGAFHLLSAISFSLFESFFAKCDFGNINFLSSANTNPEIRFDLKLSFSALTLVRGLLLYVFLSLKTLKERII